MENTSREEDGIWKQGRANRKLEGNESDAVSSGKIPLAK
jgi:hypothetical protein